MAFPSIGSFPHCGFRFCDSCGCMLTALNCSLDPHICLKCADTLRNEPFCGNVFDIWDALGRRVPFKVRDNKFWHPASYFVVKRVVISPEEWDYWARTGTLYGLAFGDMYKQGKLVEVDIRLRNAGCYHWVEVPWSIGQFVINERRG